ncbi:MAG: GNAT family N-acetyltransferase [Candidatus Berkelbacteria bacterium]|nr:GNAT family N-acetyltransferase [Candidatus Berkelbacteria bacterium]
MQEKYKFVAVEKDYSEFIDKIVAFYRPRYETSFTKDTVLNSTIICLAFDGDKVVGAVRTISDLSRHGLIVDLIVEKAYRQKHIGTNLLQLTVVELKKHNVKNIGLGTEPGVPRLVKFYQKNGFEPLKDSVFLELKSGPRIDDK